VSSEPGAGHTDPFAVESASQLLPQDIGNSLKEIAENATEYKLYVRTGRHFRSVILPLLVRRSQERRLPITIEVIVLDFRDAALCERYAHYRRVSSFDKEAWDLPYVQSEIMATVLKLIDATRGGSLVKVDLYLSKRLSTFRLDATADEVIITREDPKDDASRYKRSHQRFSAYQQEFGWVKQDASKIELVRDASPRAAFENTCRDAVEVHQLIGRALRAMAEGSPYGR
jgi:hypothetical protein